ncbi:hypothetical protein [Parafrankia sp. FMc2]|uniref:hypothetical protein n=1 Tax=Parafrankia sp. FMc2 TaxID=3233196 RepID=UPI0034D7858F
MSSNRSLPPLYTLPQLARRARISEGRARALHTAAAGSRLPAVDRTDADGRPLWEETTIDAWCRVSGRDLPAESDWLFHAPDATEPAPLLYHGAAARPAGRGRSGRPIHAIVWDTPHGHVIYVTWLHGVHRAPVPERDQAALVAAELIAPRFHADALIVLVPDLVYSRTATENVTVDLYRLRPAAAGVGAGNGEPTVDWRGQVAPTEVARVIGTPLPLWIANTCRREELDRARASLGTTLTVPDVLSAWPATLARLRAAHDTGLPTSHPAAYALLLTDAAGTLATVRQLHIALPTSGPGWYLAARPAAPNLPLDLETDLAFLSTQPAPDPAQLTADLVALRGVEPDLPADADEGDAYAHAVTLLAAALADHDPALAADTVTVVSGDLAGPVTDAWVDTFSRHPDAAQVLRTRRGRRLLGRMSPSRTELFTDPAGRLIALLDEGRDTRQFRAEWPLGLPVGWGERTVIAIDHDGSYGPALALTPAEGGLRVDPVPVSPDRIGTDLLYGYGGGGPLAFYAALRRVALAEHRSLDGHTHPPHGSDLFAAISATTGPLRLPWPQVERWARQDTARHLSS